MVWRLGTPFFGWQRVVSFFVLTTFILQLFGGALFPNQVFAAEVTIDATVSTTSAEHTIIGAASVFISDQVGYRFYVDSTGTCVYSKTTNGGTSWNAAQTIDSQTDCYSPTVWYDQWTPGDTGTYIHIVTADIGNDDLWYNRLDTSNDTLLLGTSPISVTAATAQGTGSLAAGTNIPTITKGTDGTVYLAISDNDSYIVECTTGCNSAGNWSETGPTGTLDPVNDRQILLPMSGGNIMLINDDISADDIRYRIWNNSIWASWNTIDANAPENSANTQYAGSLAAIVNPDSYDIFLAYTADNATPGTDDDIRTAIYTGGSWTTKTDVVTNDAKGITNVSIGQDYNTGTVYVAYTGRTTPATLATARVYWKSSTNSMTSWGTEQGPVDASTDNDYGISLNGVSDERIHVSWYEAGPDDLFGDTIANVSPAVRVSTRGTQLTPKRVNTNNVYLGGSFVLTENLSSRSVTSITVNEKGTIDGSVDLSNIKLYYDLDTSAPYDCASESYSGSETQFGTTDSNGFSGADGLSTFTGSVTISTTQTMCVYTVLDISNNAPNNATIDVEISNPNTEVSVTGGGNVLPKTPIAISGATTVQSPSLTQSHYHWRNDNGSETTATSKTGGVEDTALSALNKLSPARLRLELSVEGATSTLAGTYRLEYATSTSVCSVATGWTDVGAGSDAWDMYNSPNITNAANTTNIAVANGGVTDENTTFLVANAGIRDTASQTGSLTLSTTNFVELEFSIIPTTYSVEGETYCFRVTAGGTPVHVYNTYPQATISADVTVSKTGSQIASADIPTKNVYFGGSFSVKENLSSRNVTGITLTENGTVDGSVGINNVRLKYDLDTSSPYNCVSESYSGTENQFGATTTFSGDNGTATFTGSVGITTTQALCLYVVADVTVAARNAETFDFSINSGSSDVSVSGGGSISPSTPLDITSSTTINGAIVTQTHYHWRNDNGSETTATSATGGVEDTPYTDMPLTSPIRLRVGISNEGFASSIPYRYKLEYGVKQSTCDAVSVWTDTNGGGISWSVYDSTHITNGETTTNIANATGGVTDENSSFLGTNGNARDTESLSATTTLTTTQHTDLEYSINTTADTPYNTTFCFRVTQNGTPLLAYSHYPEITTVKKRDFYVQRNVTTVTGTGVTLVAGVDYVAPATSSRAFVRITNMYSTGAGSTATGNTQNTRQTTAYISNPANIKTSFTISRPTGATGNTNVAWEILEFIGPTGADNEMLVRNNNTIQFGNTALTATGTSVSGVSDDNDVVVYITGVSNPNNTATTYNAGQITAKWDAATQSPVFERLTTGAIVDVSYAVVEYTGLNWNVQRVEHTYSTTTASETENINVVNSTSRTFIVAQHRTNAGTSQADFGHEVWLPSIAYVSFRLSSLATNPSNHVSVVWVIENTQSTNGAMQVQRSNGSITTGTEPRTTTVTLSPALDSLSNSSVFSMSTLAQSTTNYPRVLGYVTLTTPTSYVIWNSDIITSINYNYRTEVVEWPVSDLTIRQNYFRFYENNSLLKPSDAWPPGAADLGENQSISTLDEPLADGDVVRLRMSVRVANATMPAGFLSLKLQYAVRSTTCSAIDTWTDIGDPGSGSIWRGFDVSGVSEGQSLSSNPPSGGDLLLSVSDRAGRNVETNPSTANEFAVPASEDAEYDWAIQQNGASQRTTYCFRVVKNDDSPLDGYNYYPQIRTEGFTPATQGWRWYNDETNLTPTVPFEAENTTPTDVDKGSILKLRVTVAELKNLSQTDVRFKLQYSEKSDFSVASDLVATSSCLADSVWCYADGAGVDNATIDNAILSESDSCVSGVGVGCGVYTESGLDRNGHTHQAGTKAEYEYTIMYTNVERNYGKVYYFRLYDIKNDEPVLANTSYTNPSIMVEAARVFLTANTVVPGTVVDGSTATVSSTPSSIPFGDLIPGTESVAIQNMNLETNAFNGYRVYLYSDGNLRNDYNTAISTTTGTNAVPNTWSASCLSSAIGCYGYHTDDDVLYGGSSRFVLDDSYAALSTIPEEVFYSSSPGINDHNIVFRLKITDLQPAGIYQQLLTYVIVSLY